MKKHLTIFVLLFLIVNFSACGTGSSGSPGGAYSGGSGTIKAVVTGSKSFNPNVSHGQIKKFKVTILAEDIAEPIMAVFDGTEESGVVEHVPAGLNRTIKIEAVNPNEKVIRAGETAGLEVIGGEEVLADVSMESVPVFANLADGSVIPNTRFVARVFSDPSDKVVIEDKFKGTTLPMFDLNSNDDELFPDAATGLVGFAPSPLAVGEHELTVKNARTGRANTVSIRITDGTKMKPAPLYSGGIVGMSRLGGPITQGVKYEK
jgi:hypothetical protein